MIHFFSISSFRNRIASLLKIKKGVYSGVNDELCREFIGKNIEEIRQNRDMVLIQDELIVIKLRLPDKKQRLSKRDGFRLIYLVSRQSDIVVFLDIYPKNGPSQQLDIDNVVIKKLLLEFISETNAGTLLPFSLI